MTSAVETFLDIDSIDLSATCIKKDSLKGEIAVITGSTSNVGLGYARAIAWAGGKVVISGNNEKAGAEAVRIIDAENAPGTAIFVRCNVTVEDDVKNLATQAVDRFGKVDILVNNAMNMRLNDSTVLGSPVSDLEQSFAISGLGVMHTIKAFVPSMLERKHGVVVYSSTQFHYSPPMIGRAIYCAGKAAATSITMSLANEIGPYSESGVGVFCMIPTGVGRPKSNTDDPHKPKNHASTNGFGGSIPPEANAAGLVYSIMNAGKLHGSGISVNDAFAAMNYPYPHPEEVKPSGMRRLNDLELTLVFKNVGSGFAG